MDIMVAETAQALQKDFPDVMLETAVPFEGQADKWPEGYRSRWQRCFDRADMIAVLSHQHTKGCLYSKHIFPR